MQKKKENLVETISENIKVKIINGEYFPGERLEEISIQETYSCSRTVSREVINRLSGDGIVANSPFKGASIVKLSHEQILNLYDIEELLEGLASRLAAKNRDPDTIQKLDENLQQMKLALENDDIEKCFNHGTEFHSYIFMSSKNDLLVNIMKKLLLLGSIRNYLFPLAQRQSKSYLEHFNIYEAIRDGDENRAETLMRNHIKNGRSKIENSDIS